MPYGTDTYGVEAFGSEGVAPAQTITGTVGVASGEAFAQSSLEVENVPSAVAYANAFAKAGFAVNADLEILWEGYVEDWTCEGASEQQYLLSNYAHLVSGFKLYSSGTTAQLRFQVSIAGSNASYISNVHALPTDERVRIKLTRTHSTGLTEVFGATADVDWADLPSLGGAGVVFPNTVIPAGTATLKIGGGESGRSLPGRATFVQVKIGGVVQANPNFEAAPWVVGDVPPQARADTAGNTWTLTGESRISALGVMVLTVTGSAGIPSGEVVGSGSMYLNLDLIGTEGIPSEEAFSSGRIGMEIVGTAGIVSGEAFSVGKVNLIIVGTAGIPSGEAFSKGEVLVDYVPGWTLRAFTLDGQVVVTISTWRDLKFLKPLSDIGSGTVVLSYEDAKAMDLLNRQLVWRVQYDGNTPFAFFTEALDEQLVEESQVRQVTFSGPGVGSILDWGTVLPPGFPAQTQRSWQWTDVRAMKAFRDLLLAAQARGTCTALQATFGDATDTAGAAWTDTVSLEMEPGGTLTEKLKSLADLAGVDWIVTPTLKLDAALSYGTDRHEQVRFQVAADQVGFGRGRDRKDLRNVAYVEGTGGIEEALDAGSVGTWGRREVFAQAGESADEATTQRVASQLVESQREEARQLTVEVLADSPDRKVFRDYDVGDWVGLDVNDDSSVPESQRVVAIGVSVDTQGVAKVELACQSLFQLKERRMAKLASQGGGSMSVGSSTPSPLGPGGGIGTIIQEPLPDAPGGVDATTGANENRVFVNVTWVTIAQSGNDPVVAYQVELEKGSEGVVQVQQVSEAPVRFEPVEPGVSYTARVRAITRFGRSSAFGSDTVVAGTDATVPAQVAGVAAGFGLRTVTIVWNENAEIDVKDGHGSYDVQIDTVNTFDSVALRGKRVSGTITTFADLPAPPTPPAAAQTWYVRVRAVDSSGNAGPWSATQSGVQQRSATGDIQALAIDRVLIADGAIGNLQVEDAAITTAKVLELSATKLSAGTITAAAITLGAGGLFRAGRQTAPYHYVLLDENGIRFYVNGSGPFSGGTLNVDLNVSSGSASFSGAINGSTITGGLLRTATSGARIEIVTTPELRFYSGHALETAPGKIVGVGTYPGGSFPTLLIQAPNNGATINMPGSVIDIDATGTISIDTSGSFMSLGASGSIGITSSGSSIALQAQGAGVGPLLQMWSTFCDIHRCTVRVFGQTEISGPLYAQNTDVWQLTADNVYCWAVDAQGIVACNDRAIHMRTIGDSNHRVWYNSGIDGVEVYGNNRVRLASGGAARADFGNGGIYFYGVPGGSDADTILRIAGSQQVLKHTSSIAAKGDVLDMPKRADDNPVWRMRPVSFKWKNQTVEGLSRLERLRPDGRSVGFIAEEMQKLAPECVTFDGEDRPDGVNESGVIAYTVAGLQYLKRRVAELEATLAKVLAVPAVAAALKKG